MTVVHDRYTSFLLLDKPHRPKWWELIFGTVVAGFLRLSSGMPAACNSGLESQATHTLHLPPSDPITWRSFLSALAVIALASGVCWIMYPFFDLSNLIMVYLLGVTFVAARFGKWEALCTSFLSVIAFDFLWIPPRFHLVVANLQYIVTFVVMFVISLLISSLTLGLKRHVELVKERERRTAALYEFSKHLLLACSEFELDQIASTKIYDTLRKRVQIMISGNSTSLRYLNHNILIGEQGINEIDCSETPAALAAFDKGLKSGAGTDIYPEAHSLYLPLRIQEKSLGVLKVKLGGTRLDPSEQNLLETIANQLALALDRIKSEHKSEQARLKVQSEELKNSLLSSISHDLRTPLSAIAGAAEGILENMALNVTQQRELLSTIKEEAERLNCIVRNVLDMTRLESQTVPLKKEWHSVEELVGSSISRTAELLTPRQIEVQLDANIPLLNIDGLLLEQVFINLLENFSRYTPEESKLLIKGRSESGVVILEFCDNGPGLPNGEEELIFEKLHRGRGASGHGFGLGLTICRAIMSAHNGTISAHSGSQRGAIFTLKLPLDYSIPEVPHG